MNRRLFACLTVVCVALSLAGCTADNLEPNTPSGGDSPQVPAQAVASSSDTLIASADALLRSAAKNSNDGASSTMPVKVLLDDDDSEATGAIVKFDQASIAAVAGSGTLNSATLEFAVKESGTDSRGNDMEVRRVLKPWTEAGVTWKCGDDLNTSNTSADCPTTGWKIGRNLDAFALPRTARTHLNPGQTGIASFDVTADVQAFLAGTSNHGWVLHAATASSRAVFWSRESALKPRLVLSVTPTTPVKLAVVIENGVIATTPLQDTTYTRGAVVSYSLGAEPGYRNVLVTLDGQLVPPSGTITMSDNHVLIASADTEVVVNPEDQALVASARGLLTAADPVAAYQDHLDRVGDFIARVPAEEAEARLDAVDFVAIDPIADSAALRRLDAALANHVFRVNPPSGPSPGALRAPGGRSLTADAIPTAEVTTFVYVNGIATDPLYAARTQGRVQELVFEVSQFGDPAFEVVRYYNRNFSAEAESFSERIARCVEMLERRDRFLGSQSRLVSMVECVDDRTRNILTDQDLFEAVNQYLDVVRNRPVVDIDAQVLADTLQLLRGRGRHVIAVPHSQGNLMVQQAVNDLRTTYGFSEERDSTCVAAVSLAAPTSQNWPFPASRVQGVVLRGDLVADWLGNSWPRSENEVTRAAEAEIAQLLERLEETPELAGYINVRKLQLGMEIHRVVESYLLPRETRTIIQNNLKTVYGECAVGSVELNPAEVSIAAGDSVQLEVTIENQQGNPLAGHKPEWTSSNFSVAGVDSTGWVWGTGGGSAEIIVRVGGFADTATVTVGSVCGPVCPPYDPNNPCSCV